MTEIEKTLNVIVCRGPSCSLMGSDELVAWCRDLKAAGLPLRHDISGCTGNCVESPVVQWRDRYVTEASPEKLTELLIDEGIM